MSLRLVHVGVFAVATGGCLLALLRARYLPDKGTRVGLVGLLVTSAIWAAAQLVTFLPVSVEIASVVYQTGLVAGLATVGAWLYFCSAYTGHEYHRKPAYRYAAVAVFVGISVVKLTNPIHGRYYTIETVTTPFRYTSVELLDLHWAVTIMAYSLTAVGFYMLFQLFSQSKIRTTTLGVLVSLTAVPVLLNLFSTLEVPGLVANNYEPIGVAAFALGALYIAEDSFEQVRWTSHRHLLNTIDEAVIVVDDEDVIREFNTTAEELFSGMAAGVSLWDVVPEPDRDDNNPLHDSENDTGQLLTVNQVDEERYYLLRERHLTIGPAQAGRALVISDITTLERQRRNVQQQSEALEGFSEAVAHELRNTLGIISGNLDLMARAIEDNDPELRGELLTRMSVTTDRMSRIIDDLVMSAQLSQPVSELTGVPFQQTVNDAFSDVDTGQMSLRVDGEGRIYGNQKRLGELAQNAARLANATDSTKLMMSLDSGKLCLEMDGESFDESDAEGLFEYGASIPHAAAGMLGPNIRMLAAAQDWSVSATNLDGDGIEIIITGVTTVRDGQTRPENVQSEHASED